MGFVLTSRIDTPMDEFLRQSNNMLNEHEIISLNLLHSSHVTKFRKAIKEVSPTNLARVYLSSSRRLRSRIRLHLNKSDQDSLNKEIKKISIHKGGMIDE